MKFDIVWGMRPGAVVRFVDQGVEAGSPEEAAESIRKKRPGAHIVEARELRPGGLAIVSQLVASSALAELQTNTYGT